jgi:cytochrome c oxidase assembly protein subunit 15
MLLLALLWSLWRSLRPAETVETGLRLKRGAQLVLLLLTVQIALGGWTSSQYAGLACPDFPTCQGQWLPDMNLNEAFRINEFTDANHEGGLLTLEARVTIQVMHRMVALLLSISIVTLSIALWRYHALRLSLSLLLTATVVQVSLGVANAVLLLPLPLALAHNSGAALLLICLLDLTLRLTIPNGVTVASKHASATMLSG